jgi:hypothetical protein
MKSITAMFVELENDGAELALTGLFGLCLLAAMAMTLLTAAGGG